MGRISLKSLFETWYKKSSVIDSASSIAHTGVEWAIIRAIALKAFMRGYQIGKISGKRAGR